MKENSNVYIQFTDGTEKTIFCHNIFNALEKQKELLKNKNFMKKVNVLQVK